ncbi:kinase-like protein, partial [Fistulina hepatica ATCC 64428]
VQIVGVPAVHIEGDHYVVGSSQTSSLRSYTTLKALGDGSFGTVELCDWHGPLPPNIPLSPMQAGGARPEYRGKRLVAVKRMKKKWEGGWDECQKLKELESLRAIPFHPNIVPLYDFFLQPDTKELYFVFESMEGNLYHLIKSRRGRPLAGGLVSSIFRQMVSGLHHIHAAGYFHRDMKPENVLVTTTGLFDYTSLSPLAGPHTPPEKDVVAIIKLADFGLARETASKQPYTEYVSTRWYRAPEVLLMSKYYSNPVDMWALGTIMAELVNLRPLFPGADTMDQIGRICDVLGDPSDEYGFDMRGHPLGGGAWHQGVELGRTHGFTFPRVQPKDLAGLFERTVPLSLIDCIRDLLRYEPARRLTSIQCLNHPYLLETIPRNNIPFPPGIQVTTSLPNIHRSHNVHPLQNAHSPLIPYVAASHRQSFYPRPVSTSNSSVDLEFSHEMEIYQQPSPMDGVVQASASQEDTSRAPGGVQPSGSNTKFSKLGSLSFKPKWGFGKFGAEKVHPPQGLFGAQDSSNMVASGSTAASATGFKRAHSSGSDVHALDATSAAAEVKKTNRKEAERVAREADRQRRLLAERAQREQARAVMQKRSQLNKQAPGLNVEWSGVIAPTERDPSSGPIRHQQQDVMTNSLFHGGPTVGAAAGRFSGDAVIMGGSPDWRREHGPHKMRRRGAVANDYEDDTHTMSSASIGRVSSRVSSISFASMSSDPGTTRLRSSQSLWDMPRVSESTASSSFQTDECPDSVRSSNSLSLEMQHQQCVHPVTPLSETMSPPLMQSLSLSPAALGQPTSLSGGGMGVRQDSTPTYVTLSPPGQMHPSGVVSPYELDAQMLHQHARSPGLPKSAINPIFKVPPLIANARLSTSSSGSSSQQHLPPFSALEAIAGEYNRPMSPMML